MWRGLLLTAGIMLSGCAAQQEVEGEQAGESSATSGVNYGPAVADDPRDPFEPVNRASWVLNYDILEPYAVRPVVHAYADYVPEPAKTGVQNMMLNLEEPASMVNHLITGDLPGAGTNLARFTLNSTVGVLGFFDVADNIELMPAPKDFSQVMGQIGITDGPYLMIPVLGPTTLRQLSGDVVDTLYFPYDLMTFAMRAGKFVAMGLYDRSQVIDQEPVIDNSLDPYGLVKDFYLQYQAAKIGKEIPAGDEEDLSEFMDEIDG
ncbi:MlaA family lipoprotein [Zobellella maritima]|uniref:MlaA family lipoprotein n=1 Tax=Zobellella maritima TaxID=2059725 RepID=UPI000E30AD63|nr:VacJ family lipoprotein [Zobellella maritima]